MTNLSGQRLGQYQIVTLLGTGGMASVYRARQARIDRDVAIKLIKSDLARSTEFQQRFEREARTIAALSHPHIVKLFDYGEQDDLIYLVMELLTGGSLADLLDRESLSMNTVRSLLHQMTSALDYAHEKGILHRDLKPQNVLLDEKRNAYLTDFGIAKILTNNNTLLTQTGAVMGTPAYMAPEQWRGESIDARADLYSLGVILYEMLTGRLPFKGDTPAAMMYLHLQEAPLPPRQVRPDIPPVVEIVIQRALAKDRDSRYQSANELLKAFEDGLDGRELAPKASAIDLTAYPATPLSDHPSAVPVSSSSAWRSSQRPGGALIGLLLVLILLLGGGGIILWNSADRGTATSVPSSTPSAMPMVIMVSTAPTTTLLPPTTVASMTSSATAGFVAAAQTYDARSTTAVKATDLAQMQLIAAEQTATATLWTLSPTSNLTASFQAFLTERAQTQAALNQTTTATYWTHTPTLTPPLPTPTPFPTATLTFTATLTPVPPTSTLYFTITPTSTDMPIPAQIPTRVTEHPAIAPTANGFGNAQIMTFGGEGTSGGMFIDARFITADPNGIIYVGDYSTGTISRFDANGQFTNSWTIQRRNKVGNSCVAADRNGNVYVCAENAIIKYEGKTGEVVARFQGGKVDVFNDCFQYIRVLDDGSLVAYSTPMEDDLVYFSKTGQITKRVNKFVSQQDEQVDGQGLHVAIDGTGNIIAIDWISEYAYAFAPGGKFVTRFAGKAEDITAPAPGTLNEVDAVAIDTRGRVYIGDFDGIAVFDKDGRFIERLPYPGGDVARDLYIDDQNTLFFVSVNQEGIRVSLPQ